MAIGQSWNSMSRLNRTRISVAVFALCALAIVIAVPVGLLGGL